MISFEQPPAEKKPASSEQPEEDLMRRRLDEEREHGKAIKEMADTFASAQKELFEKTSEIIEGIAEKRGAKGKEATDALNKFKEDFEASQEKIKEDLRASLEKAERRQKKIEEEFEDAKKDIKTPEEILREKLGSIGEKTLFDLKWPGVIAEIRGGKEVDWLSPEFQEKIKQFHKDAQMRAFTGDDKKVEEESNKLKEEAFKAWSASKEKK